MVFVRFIHDNLNPMFLKETENIDAAFLYDLYKNRILCDKMVSKLIQQNRFKNRKLHIWILFRNDSDQSFSCVRI